MIILFAIGFSLACLKWGDWRRWREYYPTILFLIIGDMAYNFVFFNYSLWSYADLFNHTTDNMLAMFFIFPSVVILFLSNWPQKRLLKALYVFLWSFGTALIEYISLNLGFFIHDHGWNILWSFLLCIMGFILIRLHHLRPLAVWPICAVLGAATAIAFKLPYELIK